MGHRCRRPGGDPRAAEDRVPDRGPGDRAPAAGGASGQPNYFQPGNLIALRELALLWVADEVDVALQRYRTDRDITVHVLRGDGLAGAPAAALVQLRTLADDVGASFHTVVGDDVGGRAMSTGR